MGQLTACPAHKIDKKHVTAITIFALNNIPNLDEFTLQKFLELMNTTGSFGPVTAEQLLEIMKVMAKYLPKTCNYSLFVLIELLGIHLLPLKMKSNNDPSPRSNDHPARPPRRE